jgi:uncharacterized Zn-binding protein involved in type VI secretion
LGKPAARIGDMHKCPDINPDTRIPHVGGVIDGPGCGTVLIGGLPAAVTGDSCTCVGAVDKVTGGSTGVFIGGKPAARMGDSCAHGGEILGGCRSVLIGESKIAKIKGPFDEEKERIINKSILECTALLERKLKLMQSRDSKTIEDFKIWFGCMDDERMQIVMHRIERSLIISKVLTVNNFDVIPNEFARLKYFAIANLEDEFHTIYLGDPFWELKDGGSQTMADVLLHELSHFWDVGHTFDFDYGVDQCLFLSENYSTRAFYNADSFMYFIKA